MNPSGVRMEAKKNKTIVRRVFVNKKTKQLSVTIPKKEIKKMDPTIKFSDNLFVKVEVFKKKDGNSSTS